MSRIPKHRAAMPAPVKGGYRPERAKAVAAKTSRERRSPKAKAPAKTPGAKKAEK